MASDFITRRLDITFASGVVSWHLRLQKCVALSTKEAEFVGIIETCKKMLWVNRFLNKLSYKQDRYIVYCDSQSEIHLSK